MTGPFSEGDTEIRWSGETEPEETGGEERSNTKLATMAEMTFRFLLSPPTLPLRSPTATATATVASYLISAGHGRRPRRPLEHGCRCGRPPETALRGSSGGRDSYDDEEAAPRPLVIDGSRESSSDRRTGETRKLNYASCKAIRVRGCFSKKFVCVVHWFRFY